MEILESKKWYKNSTNNKIFFYSGLNNDNYYFGYGFDQNGIYQDNIKLHKQNEYTKEFRVNELESLFILEAKRRGFHSGVKYKSASSAKNPFLAEGEMIFDGVCLRFNRGLLFYKGRWGTVLDKQKPQMETKVIFCACHNKEHQLVFTKNEEDKLIYAEMYLTKLSFWKRLVLGVKYISDINLVTELLMKLFWIKTMLQTLLPLENFLKLKNLTMFGFSKCFFGFHNWVKGYKTLTGMSLHSEHKISIYCMECKKCGKIQYKDRWGDWETYNYKSND